MTTSIRRFNERSQDLRGATFRVLAAAAFAICTSLPVWAVNAESARYYEDALARFDKNDVSGAIIQLKNALQKDPSMLAAHVLMGKALLRNGEAPAAEAAFDQALGLGVDRSEVILPLAAALAAQGKNDLLLERITPVGLPPPVQVEVLIARSNAHAAKGDLRPAMRTLEEARALDPTSVAVRLAQARLMLRSGETNRAATLIEEALKLAPQAAAAWNLRASVAHLRGDLQAALSGYAKAIELDSGDIDARVAQAGLLIDLGRTRDAEGALAELQRISPREPRAAYLRAVLASRANDLDTMRKALAEVVGLIDGAPKAVVSQHPQLVLLAGLSHFGLGNKEKAKEYLTVFLAQNPGHPGASKVLASLYIDGGDTVRAIRLLEPLQKTAAGDPDVLSLLAAAHMADRRYGLAASVLEQAVQVSGGTADVRARLGVSLLGLGQSDVGLAQLRQALAKDPGQARSGVALAMLYLKRNQPKNALEVIDAVSRRDPGNVAALNVLGVVRAAAGDRQGARTAYEKALALDPRYHGARLNLARLDAAEGKPEAARVRLTELLKVDPRNGDAMFELALLDNQAGNVGEAVRWLEKAMTIPKQEANAGIYLTDVLLRQRKTDRALAVSKQVVARAPRNLRALFARSRAQIAAGDSNGARLTLKDASLVAGYDPVANVELARLQLAAKDRDGANYSLDRALKASPDNLAALTLQTEIEIGSGAYGKAEQHARLISERFAGLGTGPRLMGDLAMARGQYGVAIGHYRTALAKDRQPESALRLYRAHVLAGESAKALAFLEQWSRENPGQSITMRALADGYLRAGSLERARSAYEDLLKRSPEDAEVLNNLAQVALRQGDKAAALGYAESAFRLAGGDASITDTLGWVLVQQGQIERAVGILRDARLRDPASPEIRYHLAAALAQTGRHAEARAELAQVLKEGVKFDELDDARKLQRQLGP